ncbi:MAG: saccharopine dehydrogenase C-terminal domain-containing protein [Nitrososphaerales archaeon]
MRIAVMGAGMMGSVIAWDLARSPDVERVSVGDLDAARLAAVKARLGEKGEVRRVDATSRDSVVRFLKGCDVAVSALPHGAVHPVDLAAIECGARLVNTAFEDEQMALDARARRRRAVLVPGCGVAPGLSNILLAEGARSMDSAEEGHVYVGGLPQRPEPPLSYHLVFSVKGLIREYLSARVIRDGEVRSVAPFGAVLKVRFRKPIGTLEAFFTDGLGSSIHTMRGLRELDERTLRYPGHAERIGFLLEAGFFGTEKVPVGDGGRAVAPIDVSAAVLQRVLTRGDPRDVTVMRVETVGKRGGAGARVVFDLVDRYDEENRITSMGRTTGFTAAIVARMLGRGEIEGAGVLPPETALGGAAVKRLLAELSAKGVTVRKTVRSP